MAGRHPATNRNGALYREFQAAAKTITDPELILDTSRPGIACVADRLPYLAGRLGSTAALALNHLEEPP